MRKTIPLLALLILVGAFASGCANPGKKFARGMSNSVEFVRLGDFRRSMEQHGVFDHSYSAGFFDGMERTVARTGIGVYEVVTFWAPQEPILKPAYFKPAFKVYQYQKED